MDNDNGEKRRGKVREERSARKNEEGIASRVRLSHNHRRRGAGKTQRQTAAPSSSR
jgi:hypothetical protein